ncbi:MAG: GyrI-like domain-containing protein [Micromonosporaceae bacterium]|nr:GyrI-like domain-containing protein [Micromonosporaceae bacterium]
MDVRMREVPEQVVVTEQGLVDQTELEKWLPGAMGRVHAAAGSAAATTADQPYLLREGEPQAVFIVIYEGDPHEGPTQVEVCVPLRAGVQAPAGAATRTIPAHREAYTRVTKALVVQGRIGEAYLAGEAWAKQQGLGIAAAPRETYWRDFFAAADQDEVFDVAWPVH